MTRIVCPDCGEAWVDLPELKCSVCGCLATLIHKREEKEDAEGD